MSASQRIEIVVVSYFGAKDLANLYESLRAQSHKEWRLTVVDNSQSMDQAAMIAQLVEGEERARLIRSDENVGYFGAARLGLADAPIGANPLVVSNADIVFPSPDVLAAIARAAVEAPDDLGMLAPSIVSQRDGWDQNPLLVRRPTVAEQKVRMNRMSSVYRAQFTALASTAKRRFNTRPPLNANDSSDIYAPHGSFLVFLPTYFQHGGDLAHPLFLFAEELTVAEKTRALGLRVGYRPDIRLEHVAHAQIGVLRSRRVLQAMVAAARYGHDLIARNDGA
ncbi:glycosyltransferase family 2 protein [Microbacterium sp. I2]|uniref:glycosyltransferase family 2 protein n=1 Tax=Microbacterium sp. I2 TaxID=3391826 RepID=UPI003EDA3E4F